MSSQRRRGLLRYATFAVLGGLFGAFFSGFFPYIFGNRIVFIGLAALLFVCGLISIFLVVWQARR